MFRGHSRGCDVCQAVQRHCPQQPHHKGTAVRHSQRRDWPLPVLQRDGIKDAAETDSQETGESTTGQRREKGRTVAVEHWLLSSMHRWTKGTEEAAMVMSAAPLFAHGAGALHHVLHLFRERSGNHRLTPTKPNPNPGALVVEPSHFSLFTLKKTMKASGQVCIPDMSVTYYADPHHRDTPCCTPCAVHRHVQEAFSGSRKKHVY